MWITEEMKQVLKPFSILFNGIELTDYIIPQEDSGRELMGREITTIYVPGRAGSYVTGTRTPSRVIAQKVLVACDDAKELQKKLEELSGILHTELPVPLKFEDELDRTYFAMYAGAVPGYKKDGFYTATIQFMCSDPYKYADPIAFNFVNGDAIVQNNGTASALPIYEIDVFDNITLLDIVGPEKYIRLGEPAPIDTPNYERQTLLFHDAMKSLVGWTDVANVDNGYVTGSMVATQAGFEASSFGAEVPNRKWQGPAKRRTISNGPVQNFQMIATVELLNVGKQTGMIEIYCMDANGNTVAKVGIEDIMQSISEIQAKFQLGNVATRKVQHYRTADYKPAWNNYKGVLRLFRDGNRFRPYFGLVQPDGKHVWVSSDYMHVDAGNQYAAPITHIHVAIRHWPTTTPAVMRMRDLKVWRLNDPIEGTPYIAVAGDKIIIDVRNGLVLLNGEERDDLKDFFSDYFELPKGISVLRIEPFEKVSGKVIIQERRL